MWVRCRGQDALVRDQVLVPCVWFSERKHQRNQRSRLNVLVAKRSCTVTPETPKDVAEEIESLIKMCENPETWEYGLCGSTYEGLLTVLI